MTIEIRTGIDMPLHDSVISETSPGRAAGTGDLPRILVENAERNAAYVASRMAVAAVREATSLWAPDVARTVQRAASEALAAVIDALAHDPKSPDRRRDLRRAMVSALELVIAFDIAIAHGLGTSEVDAALRASTRLLSMLGLGIHATAACGE